MGAWLQFVYVSKRTFSSNMLILEFSLFSNSLFLPTGKHTVCTWSRKEVESNQGWPIGRADRLSGNRLLAAPRWAALEVARTLASWTRKYFHQFKTCTERLCCTMCPFSHGFLFVVSVCCCLQSLNVSVCCKEAYVVRIELGLPTALHSKVEAPLFAQTQIFLDQFKVPRVQILWGLLPWVLS